jgi:transcriptional regulator with XRE-family HTH domain
MRLRNSRELHTAVGEKLIQLRKIKGYENENDFARDFHLPPMQYSKLENGRTNLTVKTLVKVLAIHNTTLTAFFSMIEKD